jgi:hypothetical protein
MEILEMKKASKSAQNYNCIFCDFNTCKIYDYNRHLTTSKHIRKSNYSGEETKKALFAQKASKQKFTCNCGKNFVSNSGLWKHKQLCKNLELIDKKSHDNTSFEYNEDFTSKDIIKIILDQSKENKDLKELLIEQNKIMVDMMKNQSLTSVTNNNNSNNTTNNNFNINLFLNEKCKNALNLMDFVNQIKGNVKDLENIGIMGFVEGISKIFIRELKSLSVYERPIHCTDIKREKIYVKDQDKWEKEEDGKPKIIKAIKHITHHNIKALPQWQKENPLFSDSRSKDNDRHNQIILQIMSDEDKLYNKIITNVSKNVVIDKENI